MTADWPADAVAMTEVRWPPRPTAAPCTDIDDLLDLTVRLATTPLSPLSRRHIWRASHISDSGLN